MDVRGRMRLAEEKNVGAGAPDQTGARGMQQLFAFVIESETVNEDGVFIERTRLMQLEDFLGAAFVNSLPQVDQERVAFWSGLFFRRDFGVHWQRMRPTIVSNDAENKIVLEYQGFVGIVVTNGGYSA